MSPSFRRSGALVAAASLFVMLAPFVAPVEAQTTSGSCGGRIRTITKGNFQWTSIAAPRFSTGGSELVSFASDPGSSRHLYATNGEVVAVSRDGGCKWNETFGPDALGGTITEVAATGPRHAAVAIAGPVGPRTAVSSDGGKTWSNGGTGLPPAGDPEAFVYSKTAPGIMLMGVDTAGGALDQLYASSDHGQTWVLRSDLTDVRSNAGIAGISIDDITPDSVWGWGPGGLYHSVNGGAKFTPVDEFNGDQTAHLVARGGEALVFLPQATPNPQASTSKDNGETWFRLGAPGQVTSADYGPASDYIVMSAAGHAYLYNPNAFVWQDLDAPNPGFTDIRFNYGGEISIMGRTPRTIERLTGTGPPGGPIGFDDVPLGDYSLPPIEKLPPKQTSLGPRNRRIVLKQGESKKVTYKLKLPEIPVPLDVYFLVDTSGSMTHTIRGLLRSLDGIATGLIEENIDIEFGLAEYRSYPTDNPPREDEQNVVYRQVVDISPSTAALTAGLETLEAAAGGTFDAHLGALYQTATGEGQDVWPEGVPNKGDVPPGQEAEFRDKARGLRVVINASDEPFGKSKDLDLNNPDPTEGPPPKIPSFQEVNDALNARDIKHVGLAIGREVVKDMEKVSSGTGTFATEPVDCDSDGAVDVGVGEPLVCRLRPSEVERATNLVPAVVGLLRAVQERVPVSLEVDRGAPVVRNISPEVHEGVVLQAENALEFEVTYRCGAPQAGKRFPVRLVARSGFGLEEAAQARVVCTDEPVAVPPVTPVLPLVGLVVAPPPPPPPAPVSQLNPATQTQAQAQAQGAAAHQEQEEAQMAFVTSFDESQFQQESEFAMSSYRSRRDVPAEAVLGMGAVSAAMMLAAAVALRRRHQIRIALQRNYR